MLIFATPFALLGLAALLHSLGLAPQARTKAATLLSGKQTLTQLVGDESWLDPREPQSWILVTASGNDACGDFSPATLELAERVEASQGRESIRIRRLHLQLPEEARSTADYQDPRLKVVQADSCPATAISGSGSESGSNDRSASIWLADRAGQLWLHFPPTADPSNVARDVRKIMRSSSH